MAESPARRVHIMYNDLCREGPAGSWQVIASRLSLSELIPMFQSEVFLPAARLDVREATGPGVQESTRRSDEDAVLSISPTNDVPTGERRSVMLSCVYCRDTALNWVILDCGHVACSRCLSLAAGGATGEQRCPTCGTPVGQLVTRPNPVAYGRCLLLGLMRRGAVAGVEGLRGVLEGFRIDPSQFPWVPGRQRLCGSLCRFQGPVFSLSGDRMGIMEHPSTVMVLHVSGATALAAVPRETLRSVVTGVCPTSVGVVCVYTSDLEPQAVAYRSPRNGHCYRPSPGDAVSVSGFSHRETDNSPYVLAENAQFWSPWSWPADLGGDSDPMRDFSAKLIPGDYYIVLEVSGGRAVLLSSSLRVVEVCSALLVRLETSSYRELMDRVVYGEGVSGLPGLLKRLCSCFVCGRFVAHPVFLRLQGEGRGAVHVCSRCAAWLAWNAKSADAAPLNLCRCENRALPEIGSYVVVPTVDGLAAGFITDVFPGACLVLAIWSGDGLQTVRTEYSSVYSLATLYKLRIRVEFDPHGEKKPGDHVLLFPVGQAMGGGGGETYRLMSEWPIEDHDCFRLVSERYGEECGAALRHLCEPEAVGIVIRAVPPLGQAPDTRGGRRLLVFWGRFLRLEQETNLCSIRLITEGPKAFPGEWSDSPRDRCCVNYFPRYCSDVAAPGSFALLPESSEEARHAGGESSSASLREGRLRTLSDLVDSTRFPRLITISSREFPRHLRIGLAGRVRGRIFMRHLWPVIPGPSALDREAQGSDSAAHGLRELLRLSKAVPARLSGIRPGEVLVLQEDRPAFAVDARGHASVGGAPRATFLAVFVARIPPTRKFSVSGGRGQGGGGPERGWGDFSVPRAQVDCWPEVDLRSFVFPPGGGLESQGTEFSDSPDPSDSSERCRPETAYFRIHEERTRSLLVSSTFAFFLLSEGDVGWELPLSGVDRSAVDYDRRSPGKVLPISWALNRNGWSFARHRPQSLVLRTGAQMSLCSIWRVEPILPPPNRGVVYGNISGYTAPSGQAVPQGLCGGCTCVLCHRVAETPVAAFHRPRFSPVEASRRRDAGAGFQRRCMVILCRRCFLGCLRHCVVCPACFDAFSFNSFQLLELPCNDAGEYLHIAANSLARGYLGRAAIVASRTHRSLCVVMRADLESGLCDLGYVQPEGREVIEVRGWPLSRGLVHVHPASDYQVCCAETPDPGSLVLVEAGGMVLFGVLVDLQRGPSERGRGTAIVLCETGELVQTARFTPMEVRR